MLRRAYDAHYRKYDDATTEKQLNALVERSYPLREELTAKALSMLDDAYSSEDAQYPHYRASINQLCTRVADESHANNMERTTAAFNRIYTPN